MKYTSPWIFTTMVALLLATLCCVPVAAQEPGGDQPAGKAAPEGEEAEPTADEEAALSEKQARLAEKYARLEQLMLKMAELDAATNPRRAALLKRVVGQSKERHVQLQLETIVNLLAKDQLKRAVDNQSDAATDLKDLLEILLTENRGNRNQSRQKEIENYIKEARRILNKQRSLEGRNSDRGDDPQDLAEEQGKLAKRSGDLADDIRENEGVGEGDGADGDGNSQGNSGGDSKGNSEGGSKGDSEGDSKGDSEGDSKGDSEGDSKGDSEGDSKGDSEGDSKGDSEGDSKGDSEGDSKGDSEGDSKGDSEGDSKGDSEGDSKGDSEGDSKGDSEGDSKGDSEGDSKGDSEGDSKGDSEGDSKGDSEGDSKGDSEGDSKGDSEGDSKGDSEGDSKGDSEGDSKGDSEGDSKGDSEGDSKGDSQGDSKGDSEGDSQGGGGESPQGPQPPSGEEDETLPARQRIKAAQERMKKAQEKLEQAKRKEARAEQEAAEAELEEAIAELEEILRQLREEEIERMLAQLQSRFTAMLKAQIKVYEDTLILHKEAAGNADVALEARAGRLSFSQRKIVIEADKALTLLQEEGSSIAFPEVVEQMRDDMVQVADRLARAKTGVVTQAIEDDIIKTLEELIDALEKAQQEMEEPMPMPPGQPPPAGQPQDQPLVDQIAELKMIKSLQIRVNKRTSRYARLLEDFEDLAGQATEGELVDALKKLADRQEKITRITRDIVLGKNQ